MNRGFIVAKKYDVLSQPFAYDKVVFDRRAEMAILMLEKWGMVTGFPDGEDSVGRAKIGLMPVDQLVERAFFTAEAAYSEIERRGWSMEIPAPTIEKDR